MSLSATIRAMRASGIDDAQIIETVLALEEERLSKGRERVRKHRNTCNVTPVTDVTKKEKNQKKKTTPPSDIPPSGDISSPPRRGTRLPSDWQPDKMDRQYAAGKGLSEPEIERESEKFRNYWLSKPGQGGVKLDWRKTWQNWCISAAERKPQARASPQDGIADAFAKTRRDLGIGNERTGSQTIDSSPDA